MGREHEHLGARVADEDPRTRERTEPPSATPYRLRALELLDIN